MHYVSEEDLDSLRAGSASPSLAHFGIAVGILAASITTLATVELGPWTHAGFVAALIASMCLSLFFGFHAVREYRSIGERIDRIKAKGSPTP